MNKYSQFSLLSILYKKDIINITKSSSYFFYIPKDVIEYWPSFLHDNPELKIREVVYYEIDKVLSCRTPKLGGSVWECPNCGYSTYHFFTCKSRFCSTCGAKYSNQRVDKAMSVMFQTKHRHITFTIAEELRIYFRMDRNMLNLLFDAINYTLSSWVKEQNKKEEYTLGFILVLHTFGRSIRWNPHIHALVAEVAMGNTKIEKKMDFFPFSMLRKRFQAKLLDSMTKYIKAFHPHLLDEFKKLVTKIYKKSKNGFYVRAPKQQFKNTKKGLQYILRYCGRPVFASSRIISIKNNYITFWYQRHEDDKYVVEKIHIYEFIKRIIIHIQEKGFKTIRYYGFYSKHHKQEKHYTRMLNQEQYKMKKQFTTWRFMALRAFQEDPYECKKCNEIMKLCFYFRPGEVFFLMDKIIKFDFDSWPMPLSGKIVMYICPKCKYKIEVPIEAVKEWEEEDMWNGLDKSIPPYGECTNCNYKKTVPIDYVGTRGYHYVYKEK